MDATATIPYLPPEILSRILELAASFPESLCSIDDRQDALCDAALVCRQWRVVAQALLWERVRIILPYRVHPFLSMEHLGLLTRSLTVWGPIISWQSQGLEREVVTAIIMSCKGLQKLDLNGMELSSPLVFHLDALRGLTSLDLTDIKFEEDDVPRSSLDFPFRLSKLSLNSIRLLPSSFYSALIQSTLTTLELRISGAPIPADILAALTFIAPKLTTLSLRMQTFIPMDDPIHALPRLAPFLQAYHTLKHFKSNTQSSLALEYFPAPIKSWTWMAIVTGNSDEPMPDVILRRLTSTTAMSKLERMAIWRDVWESEEAIPLREECAKRGVEVQLFGQ